MIAKETNKERITLTLDEAMRISAYCLELHLEYMNRCISEEAFNGEFVLPKDEAILKFVIENTKLCTCNCRVVLDSIKSVLYSVYEEK